MPSELQVTAIQQRGMRFTAAAGKHEVTLDYPLQPGEEVAGMTPLQALLSSLAVCAGSTVSMLLTRRLQQPLESVEVRARGCRRDEHPTVLTEIALEFVVRGAVDAEAVSKALAMAEGQVCPVWAMLKPGTPISATFRIEES